MQEPTSTRAGATGSAGKQVSPGAAGWMWGAFSSFCGWIVLATFAADQSHKAWMLLAYRIRERGRVEILPFMDLAFVLNRGVSYGLLAGTGQWLLTVFALLTSVALWVWLARAGTGRLMAASLGLIIGGALGNGLDRVLYGGVVDYVSLHAFGYYWYVFNIADAAIVAGVVGLLYDSWVVSRNDAAKAR